MGTGCYEILRRAARVAMGGGQPPHPRDISGQKKSKCMLTDEIRRKLLRWHQWDQSEIVKAVELASRCQQAVGTSV